MNQPVPTFLLYGEAPASVTREFVHIEEISARSAARNWQIGVHRHEGLFQLLFVFSGAVRVRLDSSEQEWAAPLAVIVPPGVVHAFKFMPGTQGHVLTLDDEGLGGPAGAGDGDDAIQAFAVLRGEAGVMSLESEDGALVRRAHGLLEQIADEFARPGAGSARMYVWLVRALLLLLVREQLRRHPLDPASERHAALMKRFRQLVDKHYHEHWHVERYAQALNLTESRLNRLCRREAGCSAFSLIQDRLLLEARRRLIFTAVPVSQLAFELGFSDPAYFTRFFKKIAGVTPAAFRALGAQGAQGGRGSPREVEEAKG